MTTTAFCASCGTARGLGRFCTNCGRAYEVTPSKGWPPIVWIPAMIVAGLIVFFLIAGVPR